MRSRAQAWGRIWFDIYAPVYAGKSENGCSQRLSFVFTFGQYLGTIIFSSAYVLFFYSADAVYVSIAILFLTECVSVDLQRSFFSFKTRETFPDFL